MENLEAIADVQMGTVHTDTFSMDYFRFGKGDRILVILPGLSVQSVMGFAQSVADEYRIFGDHYTVYVFDRRKELPDSYSIQEMAHDTAEAIRMLGLSRINLFGASQGGMISMVMAIEDPDLIKKLALGSTSSDVTEALYQKINEWIRLAKAGDKTGLYLAFGEAIYPPKVYEQSRDLLKEAAKTVTDEDIDRFIVLAEGLKDFDITKDLKKIVCPVLVIGSRDDQVMDYAASVQIAENLSNQEECILYLYDEYGHAAYDLAPDYQERLLQFFMPHNWRKL